MSKLALRIVWDECGRDQWTGLLSRVPNSCYMNSWAYGLAVRDLTRMVPRRGLVYHKSDPIGMVQAFQALYLLKTYTITKVLRGPQWLVNDVSEEEQVHIFTLMQEYFGNNMLKTFQLLPELEDSPENRKLMEALGLTRSVVGYEASFLDIRPDLDSIRSNFKEGWRQSLEFAEKQETKISFSNDFHSVEWLLDKYDKGMEKQSIGPNADFIRAYLRHSDQPYVLIKAEPDLAGVLVVTHGLSATYMIGWSSPEGRKIKASHLLLWEMINNIRNMGVDWIDLGITDMKSDHGAGEFKEGMGGKTFKPVGVYV